MCIRDRPVGVSVLCPSWVNTRLMEDEPDEVDSPLANLMGAMVRSSLENDSIAPAEVADQVVDAIRSARFWILTHPASREFPVQRMQRAADQANPILAGP